jgi:hypothetical protein
MTEERFCSSMLPVYSERSARSKLERHRRRGDPLHTMFACPWADHWHVIEGTLAERVEADE